VITGAIEETPVELREAVPRVRHHLSNFPAHSGLLVATCANKRRNFPAICGKVPPASAAIIMA
jgi:hypothetical protein